MNSEPPATSSTLPADRRAILAGLGGLAAGALLVGSRTAHAGPLNPPAGPVTPTGKTLTEVEPRIAINATNTPGETDSLFKITQPGSYYLTGNITGVVGKHGIEITASGVTLDLNGFDVLGPGPGGPFDGVSATASNLTKISVLNGTVRNWGRDGINLGDVAVTGCRVEGVHASGNARIGIYAGVNAVLLRCSGRGGQYGVYGRNTSTITDCTAMETSFVGIGADPGSVLTNCAAYLNTGTGIGTNGGCTVLNCSSSRNELNGISVADGCSVVGCMAYTNTGNGITVSSGSTVSNCTVTANDGSGIQAFGAGCTIADCTAYQNLLDGIRCTSSSVIRGNTSSSNGFGGDGAGIYSEGADNRIEGNTCTGADRGIRVGVAGNFTARNTCSGNTTNWDVASGNILLVVNAATAGAVSGNSGGVAPGSTDPNANFTF